MNIQKLIDELLGRFPAAGRFVDWIRYVGPNQPLPEDATHSFRIANAAGQEIVFAAKVKSPYHFIVDAILQLF